MGRRAAAVWRESQTPVCVAGASKVPEGLPQLQQGGNRQLGRSAAAHQIRERPQSAGHDSQDAEGAGARRPAEGHVRERVEEGRKGLQKNQKKKHS